MKKELDELLCQRYPLIFAERHLSQMQTCMCWGIACGDGWFDLIDTLCERLQFWTDRTMNDPAVMHAVYRLADYPVLTSLASERTKATKLDGRACRYIYEAALPRIDWQAVSANERAFMRSLGIALTTAELIAVLQTLPPDLPVMIPTEGGIDHALSLRVAEVARHSREWASTPVGQYRELPDDGASGEPFRVVLIDLEPGPT